MSKNTFVFLLGILVAIMPFLGFPYSWKTIFYTIAGIILSVIAISTYMKTRTAAHQESPRSAEVFAENTIKITKV